MCMVLCFLVPCVWHTCCSPADHDRRKDLHRESHWTSQCGWYTDMRTAFTYGIWFLKYRQTGWQNFPCGIFPFKCPFTFIWTPPAIQHSVHKIFTKCIVKTHLYWFNTSPRHWRTIFRCIYETFIKSDLKPIFIFNQIEINIKFAIQPIPVIFQILIPI